MCSQLCARNLDRSVSNVRFKPLKLMLLLSPGWLLVLPALAQYDVTQHQGVVAYTIRYGIGPIYVCLIIYCSYNHQPMCQFDEQSFCANLAEILTGVARPEASRAEASLPGAEAAGLAPVAA